MSPFRIVLDCAVGLCKEQVRVVVPEHAVDMWQPGWPGAAEQIERVWASRLEKNPRLFNATKFRLLHACGGEGWSEVAIGLTDYRSYLGTNQASNHLDVLSTHGDDTMSDPLGCATFILTTDSHTILQKRSQHVGEYPLTWAAPGGHAEPSDLGITVSLNGIDPLRIRDELFSAAKREVIEETGLGDDDLEEPLFIGISQRVDHHRPVSMFIVRTRLTAPEVLARFTPENARDHFESESVIAVRLADVSSFPSQHPMPGCQQGGLVLLGRYLRAHGLCD